MEFTIAKRFDLHTRILEYIILNPDKIPDMIIPNCEHRMHFRPISAIRNTGFIVCETFSSDYNDDEQREMFVEIDIQNPGNVNIKYSIPINKSGHTELVEIAKAKITPNHYMIEDVIMNDYRDKHFFAYGEIEKIKVQITHVTTMLLLYAYQIRMQYGLLNIPEEIDDISIIDNFSEKPSKSEENDEESSEEECESYKKTLDYVKDDLKIQLETFVKKQYFQYKTHITSVVADLLEDTENKVKDEVSDIFHERFNKLETSNEKMSNDIESIKRNMSGFKREMAEYTQTLFQQREVQMMDRIIEKLKNPDEPDEEFANTLKELNGGVDPKLCVKVLKDKKKEPEVDESVVFNYNCKDIFARLARVTREMCTRASSTCHESGQLSFRDTINIRGDIDREEFKKVLNSPFCRGSYMGNQYQKRFIEEGAINTYHISCMIDSFLSGAVLFKFNIRDNLIYPKGVDINFNFNDNHDLCVVDNTLWDFDELKANILFRYMIIGNRGDGFVVRELMNICNELKKRKAKVEKDGK